MRKSQDERFIGFNFFILFYFIYLFEDLLWRKALAGAGRKRLYRPHRQEHWP
jgi:hypothetical protein